MRAILIALVLAVAVSSSAAVARELSPEAASQAHPNGKEQTCQQLFMGALTPAFQPFVADWVRSKHNEQLHPTIRSVNAEHNGTIAVATETRTAGRDLHYVFWFKWENGGWKLVEVQDAN